MSSSDYVRKMGGRKFIMTALVFLVSTVLVLLKKIDSQSYYDVMKLLISGYPLGNVAQSLLLSKLNLTENVEEDFLGGRKFILTILIYITIAALYAFEYIQVKAYVDLTYWIVCVYILGNITSKAIDGGMQLQPFIKLPEK